MNLSLEDLRILQGLHGRNGYFTASKPSFEEGIPALEYLLQPEVWSMQLDVQSLDRPPMVKLRLDNVRPTLDVRGLANISEISVRFELPFERLFTEEEPCVPFPTEENPPPVSHAVRIRGTVHGVGQCSAYMEHGSSCSMCLKVRDLHLVRSPSTLNRVDRQLLPSLFRDITSGQDCFFNGPSLKPNKRARALLRECLDVEQWEQFDNIGAFAYIEKRRRKPKREWRFFFRYHYPVEFLICSKKIRPFQHQLCIDLENDVPTEDLLLMCYLEVKGGRGDELIASIGESRSVRIPQNAGRAFAGSIETVEIFANALRSFAVTTDDVVASMRALTRASVRRHAPMGWQEAQHRDRQQREFVQRTTPDLLPIARVREAIDNFIEHYGDMRSIESLQLGRNFWYDLRRSALNPQSGPFFNLENQSLFGIPIVVNPNLSDDFVILRRR